MSGPEALYQCNQACFFVHWIAWGVVLPIVLLLLLLLLLQLLIWLIHSEIESPFLNSADRVQPKRMTPPKLGRRLDRIPT